MKDVGQKEREENGHTNAKAMTVTLIQSPRARAVHGLTVASDHMEASPCLV